MSFTHPRLIAPVFLLAILVTGCFPSKPIYLCDNGQLDHYLEKATAIEHPDVHTMILDEVAQSRPPITLADPDFDSFWDLQLEEAISIALQNSKVIRGYGTPGLQSNRVAPGIDQLANGPVGAGTVYNVAVRESEPGFISLPGQFNSPGAILSNTALDVNQGVEAALADFDTHFTTSLFWDRSDTPRNTTPRQTIPGSAAFFQQDALNFQAQLAKRTASGTQFFLRNTTAYTANNIPLIPNGFQALSSIWQTAIEFEVRQPLMRGRGAFINRMPIVISRIGTDQEVANLEAQLQNMVTNVEIRYWDLQCAYRALEAAKLGRDSARETWRVIDDNVQEGNKNPSAEPQAREQYFFFRDEVERRWSELLDAETNLRYLLGVAATDSRLIRPIDEPFKAPVEFDYGVVLDEALTYRPELRQERWEVKKKQLAVAYAKNSLLPNVNAVAQYRWLGLGDRLVAYQDGAPNFPSAQSGAWNDLLGGNYQEFRMGLEAGLPIGLRRELSNVTNAQLKYARELARLEDMELDMTRELQTALRALSTNYQLAQTNFNRWIAAAAAVNIVTDRYSFGEQWSTIDVVLDTQRRRALAEIAYYQALCEYNKLIALIHRRKGTVLAYCGVYMDEGPWAGKAYCDAAEYARKRSASLELNYGWTRPEVISRGAMSPGSDCGQCLQQQGGATPVYESGESAYDYGEYYVPSNTSPQSTPSGQPNPANVQINGDYWQKLPTESFDNNDSEQPMLSPSDPGANKATVLPPRDASIQVRSNINESINAGGLRDSSAGKSVARIKWEKMGLTQPPEKGNGSSAVIRLVNHEEQE